MRRLYTNALLVLPLVALALVSAWIGLVLSRGEGTDWVSFYAAGTLVRAGRGEALFDPAVQAATQRALFGPHTNENAFPLPAFVAYVFEPLSLLSFSSSYFVWLGVNVGALGGLLYVTRGYLASLPGLVRTYWLAGAALSTPTAMVVFQGQIDFFILASILGCFVLLSQRRPAAAGAALGFAVAKPQFTLAVLLLLLLNKEWRALASFCVVATLLIAIPVVLSSPRTLLDQASLIASYPSSSTAHSVHARLMVNIRGTVTSIDASAPTWAWAAPLALLATAALTVSTHRWLRRPSNDPQAWALALLLPLICSPHVHLQSLVFFVAAATMYVRAISDAGKPPRPTRIALAQLSLTGLWLVSLFGIGLLSVFVIGAFIMFACAWPVRPAEHGADADAEKTAARRHGGHLATAPARIKPFATPTASLDSCWRPGGPR